MGDLLFQQLNRLVGIIQGGSIFEKSSKRQFKEYSTKVNIIGALTPTAPSKWASTPLTFTEEDAKGIHFPHNDTLSVTATVANSKITKILVDGGSSVDILYLHAPKDLLKSQGAYEDGSLEPSLYPLNGFILGKSIRKLGQIELPMTFQTMESRRTEPVCFDVVDIESPFSVIMGRTTLNRFYAVVHETFLCMKVPIPKGPITVRREKTRNHHILHLHEMKHASKEEATKGVKSLYNVEDPPPTL